MPAVIRDAVPYWVSPCGRATVHVGDCREVMSKMGPSQFHAVVTDPPYGLGKEPDVVEVMTSWIRCGYHEVGGGGFMGKKWDAFVPQPATWRECAKVMKPGAHILCFAGTRTLDWMGMALRFVGMQCRDVIMWVYSSGFPKGLNVSKKIDKLYGLSDQRGYVDPKEQTGGLHRSGFEPGVSAMQWSGRQLSDDPVSDDAKRWNGWNTVLKPAVEPIILARKALDASVVECVLKNCTGAINIDRCRIGTTGATIEQYVASKKSTGSNIYQFNSNNSGETTMNGDYIKQRKDGRWPTNLIHDGSDDVVNLFTNDANRFFYTTKADDDDRPHGRGTTSHPTVKPLDLMCYLVRLITPPDGTVLDPFVGSGSTGCAAIAEGMKFVGIEQSEEYADIAVGRLKLALGTSARAAPTTATKLEGVE